ncbi:type III restriction protein res subunit [Ferroglobus placidus DSM 10642]|uniref:DNA 3'-5' helicase n=1 Tax=Ferroglobus placidus (strain DSM 10642 / AEDII12DO) TaxID=589924 RepID=D3S309_FERPA|nr:DEAD/DEAH box helicase family protein [Ferroglobus placidus]ADC64642.1 type III restriction protein res subunit [Ferroglobus placidus DSM 10642]
MKVLADGEIRRVVEDVEKGISRLDELVALLQEEKRRFERELEEKLSQLQILNLEDDVGSLIEEFLEEPYLILPKRKDEYYVIVPKFIRFNIGWLERETKAYRIFVINRYTQWLYPLPENIKKRLKFPEVKPYKVIDGVLWTGREHQDEAWRKYRKYLLRREGEDRIKIKKGYEFELIAKLIEDGILPFIPQPVSDEDLREWDEIKLRSYQEKAWEEFLDKGAVGIFWPFGAGKSLFGVYALARIKGKKLVVVPTRTLVEQWEERIRKYIPEYASEIEVITYHSYHKVAKKEFTLTIFDEVHHLPANTFIRLATIKTKYRIGLSGSPFREDKRENYIFALTGFPVGLSWDELLEKGVVKEPVFKLYIVDSEREKLRKLRDLLEIPAKTIIFCDSIDFGKRIAREFGVPFVYGETKNRMDIIRDSEVCVVSRVGDEGISIGDVERVVEIAFLGGSRMQESQRFGRLMHSQKQEPEHIILMTEEEFEKYQKRLYAITERGFRIEVVR